MALLFAIIILRRTNHLDVPKGHTYMYGLIVCNYHPQKDKPHRTWLTMGGNCIDYPWNKSTSTANLTTAKLLFNSTIYTSSTLFYSINLANFYLNTPMERYEYKRLRLDILPQEIINEYNLNEIVNANRWVYVEICKGVYGLPQASILANKLLKKCLTIRGYYQCQHTPGLWRHMWRDITFCFIVDNFGIKTTSMANMKHLVSFIQENYSIAVDWTGSLFCRVKLMQDYVDCMVDLHMPDYISKALLKYQHQAPLKPQHAPYKATPIQFGARVQTVTMDTTAPLSKECIKRKRILSEHFSITDVRLTWPFFLPSGL